MNIFFNIVVLITLFTTTTNAIASEAVEPELKRLTISSEAEAPKTTAPQFKEISIYDFYEMLTRANKGDEGAQREIISRHYYGFLVKRLFRVDINRDAWTILRAPEEDPESIDFILNVYQGDARYLWPKLYSLLSERSLDCEIGNLAYLPYEYLCGVRCAKGYPIGQNDIRTAGVHYMRASSKGHPKAHLAYANALADTFAYNFQESEEFLQDKKSFSDKYDQAISLYQRAANEGFMIAHTKLTELYLQVGIHVDPTLGDLGTAILVTIPLLVEAAEKGVAVAQNFLSSDVYSAAIRDSDRRQWSRRAAAQGVEGLIFMEHEFYRHRNACEALRTSLSPCHKYESIINYLSTAFVFNSDKPRQKPLTSMPRIDKGALLSQLVYRTNSLAGLIQDGMIKEFPPCLHKAIDELHTYSNILTEIRNELYLPMFITSYSCTQNDQFIGQQLEPHFLRRDIIHGINYLTIGEPYVKKAKHIIEVLSNKKEGSMIALDGSVLAAYAQCNVSLRKDLGSLCSIDMADLAYTDSDKQSAIRTFGQAQGTLKRIIKAYTEAIKIAQATLKGFNWALSSEDVANAQKRGILEEALQELTNMKEAFLNLSMLFEGAVREIHDQIRNADRRNGAAAESIYYKNLYIALKAPGFEEPL